MSPPCAPFVNHHHSHDHQRPQVNLHNNIMNNTQKRLPVTTITQINPTYISTDLVTPGKPNRETLPGIGQRDKLGGQHKLWGQETKQTSNGDELAYHHFKPSHYINGPAHSKVVVTHGHYDSRTYNIDTSNQPYQVINLLPSKYRFRMPRPLQSKLVHDTFIPEPYCKEFCDSYFSHRSQFKMFPTSCADLIDAETKSTKVPTKFKLTDRTKQTLADLNKQYYSTTTYNQFHQQPFTNNAAHDKHTKHYQRESNSRRKNVRFKIFVRTCKLCGLEINQNRSETGKKSAATSADKSKNIIAVKLYWPPGELNISNSHSDYPKLKLPKYSLRPQSLRKKKAASEAKEQFCQCKGKVPVMINSYVATPSNENLAKKDGVVKRKKTPAQKGIALSDKSEERLLPHRLNSGKFKRGFKTDTRHKFLREHQETIPNLGDAVQTGKKHNFFGWNVNFFRG